MIRIWIDAQTLKENLNEDGDFVLRTEDFFFFKRHEIAAEEGYHLEFNSNGDGGYEIHIPFSDFRRFLSQMQKKVLDYAETDRDS